MANTQLTWVNIAEFVAEVHQKEGARANPSFYRTLGNQALGIISERMGGLADYEWTNAAEGALTISGNSVALPDTCLGVDSVEWEGDRLERKSIAEMDAEMEGWRDGTGETPSHYATTGHSIKFDLAPMGTTTGKLEVRGHAALPAFSDGEGAVNPLLYLPSRLQLLPAYYILANLPFDPQNPAEMTRYQRYQALWEAELQAVGGVMDRRQHENFNY